MLRLHVVVLYHFVLVDPETFYSLLELFAVVAERLEIFEAREVVQAPQLAVALVDDAHSDDPSGRERRAGRAQSLDCLLVELNAICKLGEVFSESLNSCYPTQSNDGVQADGQTLVKILRDSFLQFLFEWLDESRLRFSLDSLCIFAKAFCATCLTLQASKLELRLFVLLVLNFYKLLVTDRNLQKVTQ